MHSGITRLRTDLECHRMKTPDPASLQNLNDIVLPTAINWWPLANGWYFLFGILAMGILWLAYRSRQRWNAARYRRAALHELQLLEAGIHSDTNRDSCLRQIPILLKRTALSAYPRHEVASLSGAPWYDFLNSKVRNPLFTDTTVAKLDSISYSSGDLGSVDHQDATALLDVSKQWLKHHANPARDGGET
jgi:hypothetical protein